MAHLCVPQNQALGVCRGFVPDIQVCGTHGREDLVNATITSNAEEEDTGDSEIDILRTTLPYMGIIGSMIGLVGLMSEYCNGSDSKFDLKLYLSVAALMIFQPDPYMRYFVAVMLSCHKANERSPKLCTVTCNSIVNEFVLFYDSS